MSGFPTRPSRNAFGPVKQNKLNIIGDPETHENAAETNLQEWQISGAGQMVPIAWFVVLTDAVTPTIVDGGYAWDPNNEIALPSVVRDSAGLYTVTLPATGTDEAENEVPIVLRWGKAHAQTAARLASAEVTSNNTVQVGNRTAATDILVDTTTYILVEVR